MDIPIIYTFPKNPIEGWVPVGTLPPINSTPSQDVLGTYGIGHLVVVVGLFSDSSPARVRVKKFGPGPGPGGDLVRIRSLKIFSAKGPNSPFLPLDRHT